MPARHVSRIVECARVAEVSGLPDAGLYFDQLPIRKPGQLLSGPGRESDANSDPRFQFSDEPALDIIGLDRLRDASGDKQCFTGLGIELRRGAGASPLGSHGAGDQHRGCPGAGPQPYAATDRQNTKNNQSREAGQQRSSFRQQQIRKENACRKR
jgi:hypothetical protein